MVHLGIPVHFTKAAGEISPTLLQFPTAQRMCMHVQMVNLKKKMTSLVQSQPPCLSFFLRAKTSKDKPVEVQPKPRTVQPFLFFSLFFNNLPKQLTHGESQGKELTIRTSQLKN